MKDFMQGFEPADFKRWQNKIAEDLLKISLDTRLIKQDYEGLQIHPLYARDSQTTDLEFNNIPGHYPNSRSDKPFVKKVMLVHRVQGEDFKEINDRVKNAVSGGADSLLINLDHSKEAYIDLINGDEFHRVLSDIDLTQTELIIDMGEEFMLKTLFINNVLKENNLFDRDLKINFKIDPISFWAKNGAIKFDIDFYYSNLCELLLWKEDNFKDSKFIEINSSVYHNAGASEEQEIAFSLSIALEYLRAFHKYGIDLSTAIKAMSFKLSYDSKFFTGISKTRALRWCWSRILEEFEISSKVDEIHINAQSSRRMLSIYDPWVNILRSTLASFSAMNSSVDSLEVFNFDLILNEKFEKAKENEFSELFSDKVSRNTFHILKDESFGLSVVDPAGGSFFVEEHTTKLAKKSWDIFQEIEKSGGFVQCLKSNIIQSMIEVTVSKRLSELQFKFHNCTGVNDFPNDEEKLRDGWSEKVEDHGHQFKEYKKQGKDLSKLVKSIREYKSFDKANTLVSELDNFLTDLDEISLASHCLQGHQEVHSITPVGKFRDAHIYEELRLKVEELPKALKIKVLSIGARPKLSARLSFVINYFQVVGLECEIVEFDSIEELGDISSDVIAFVSTDSKYEEIFSHDNFKKIQTKKIIVAGKFSNPCVAHNIYKHQDAVTVLKSVLKTLGAFK
jgi:methylmalonyl-CoA mutase